VCLPALRKRAENPLGVGRIFAADCKRESLRLGVPVRRTIRPMDHAGSNGESEKLKLQLPSQPPPRLIAQKQSREIEVQTVR
jgi:hypothetical protein